MIDLSIRFRHINHNRDVALFNLSRDLEKKVGGRKAGMSDIDYVGAVAKDRPWIKKETRENIFGAYQKAIENLAKRADLEMHKYIKDTTLVRDEESGLTVTREGQKIIIISQDGIRRDWESLEPVDKMEIYNIFSELIY